MPTLTLQPDATAGVDTYIQQNAATTNFGTNTSLFIGENTGGSGRAVRTLIKFDLSTLPADAIITSATLSLFALTSLASNAANLQVFRVKRAWVEAEATWNIYSTGNNWSTAGGFHTDDCEQTAIGTRAMSATETLNEFKDITLTPTTKAALDLGNGFLCKTDTELNDGYGYASSDHATNANRPKLVIVYTTAAADDNKAQVLEIGPQLGIMTMRSGGARMMNLG